MAKWTLEPGHTAAEFSVRHMMVTWVRGAFKDVHGTVEFDPKDPTHGTVEVEIDASGLWSGEPGRDVHLKNEDFLHVEEHPKISYRLSAGVLRRRIEPTQGSFPGAAAHSGALWTHRLGRHCRTPRIGSKERTSPPRLARFCLDARPDSSHRSACTAALSHGPGRV